MRRPAGPPKRTLPLLAASVLAVLIGLSPAAGAAPAAPAAGAENPASSPIIRKKLEWVVSDLTRLVEEIRRAESPAARKLMAEDAETILYRDVTFPLLYKGGRRRAPGGADGNFAPPAAPCPEGSPGEEM